MQMSGFKTIKDYGNSSQFPPNWKRAKADEFWAKFLTYGSIASDIRQPERPAKVLKGVLRDLRTQSKGYVNARLYFYPDGSGLAFVDRYNHLTQKHSAPVLYKFALCEHDMKRVERSMRGHRKMVCAKCSYTDLLDAAD